MKIFQKVVIIMSLIFGLNQSCLSQKSRAEMVLKNGDTLVGLVKITNGKVKFRSSKEVRPDLYLFEAIKQITIHENSEPKVYQNIPIKNLKAPNLLLLEVSGKVNLYTDHSFGYMATGPSGVGSPGGTSFGGGQFYSVNHYYLKRHNEETAFHIGSDQLFSTNFKKAASDYFSDCLVLKQKIEAKEFKKRDLVEIVNFYNSQCN